MSTVQVATDGSIASKAVAFTIDADLMRNHAAATVVDPQHSMAVVSDQQGQPMLFSVGNDGVLRVLLRDDDSPSGWQHHDLSSAIGPDLRVTTFTVTQNEDHRVVLAAALASTDAPLQGTLHVTPPITPDATLTRWSDIGQQWVARPFTDAPGSVTRILVGPADEQGGTLGVAAVQRGDVSEVHRFNVDAGDRTWAWQPFPLPENAVGPVTDIAVGKVLGDWGVYALYSTASGQTLEFTSLPDPRYHKSSRYDFPLPGHATTIAALPSAETSYDLFLAGDGVHLYEASGSTVTTVAGAHAISDAQRLLVRRDDVGTAVYVVTGDQLLSYCASPRAGGATWSPPVPIRRQVTQLTATRSGTHLSNELFVVKADSTLTYVYQDGVTSLWNETSINLPALDRVVEMTTYTAHVRVEGENGASLYGHELALTASSWAYAMVNGRFCGLDQRHPITVSPDVHDTITIIIPTDTISAPVLHLGADFLTEVVDVVPTTSLHEGLEQMTSGDDFRRATLQDGSPLVARKVDQATLDSAARAVQQLTTAVGSPAPPARARSFAGSVRAASASPALTMPAPPPGQVWGMHFETGQARHLDDAGVRAHFAGLTAAASVQGTTTVPMDAVAVEVGSGLEWLWDQVSEVGAFLVEAVDGALTFVFQVGQELFRFAVTCAEAAYRVIHWVLLKTLGIDLDRFIDWLGFIFDWDDIKRVHTMLVELMNGALTYGRGQVDGARTQVGAWFDDLKAKAASLQPDTGPGSVFDHVDHLQSSRADTDGVRRRVLSSPGGNWGSYHLSHSGALTGTSVPRATPSDPFSAFLDDVVWPTLDSVSDTAHQLGIDLAKLFGDTSMTTTQVMQLISDAAVGLLDALETIVTGLMQFVEDLIAMLQTELNTPIAIPFFSPLYKQISGNDLTVMDAIMLVLAVPTTIVYKIVAGRAPAALDPSAVFPGSRPVVRHAGLASMAAAEPAEPAESADGLSQGQKDYQRWGGLASLLVQVVGDGLAVEQALTLADVDVADTFAEAEALNEKAEKLGPWRAASELAKVPGCFPLGEDAEVGWQRGVWGFELVSVFVELALERFAPPALKRQVLGTWGVAKAFVVIVLECVVFAKEMDHEDGSENGMDVVKLVQNVFYFVGTGSNGVLCLVPRGTPASGFAVAGALGGAALGGVVNGIRLLVAVEQDLEYQRY